MKNQTTSLRTKTALVNSLKKIMLEKPLNKISIREIVEDCGVNRKTFYYHFQDIYDLVKWMFEVEAIEVVKQYDLIIDYEDAIRFALDYLDDNQHICNCAYDTLGRGELKKFFHNDFFGMIQNFVNQVSEGVNIPEDYKEFICWYYTESFASMLIKWIHNKHDMDKEKIVKYISITLFESLKDNFERAEKSL